MASIFVQIVAFALTGAGALCLYLSAPRQQWLPGPWPARLGRIGGGFFLVLGFLLWCAVMHPATAFFTSLTVSMALFIALPCSAALSILLGRQHP